jgi:hypothetical protein
MDLGAWTETTWAAAAAWGTFFVYLALLLFAARQLGEARRLREQEARPYVVVQFEPDFVIHFAIENMGRTVARNIQIAFNERPVTTKNYDPWNDHSESAVLRDGIPFLAPGGKMRFIFDSFPSRIEAGLPLVYHAIVSYESFDGRHRYSDPYTLDLSLYLGVLQVTEKGLDDLAKSLDKIQKEMHKWTDGHAGIRVSVSSQYLKMLWRERNWHYTKIKRAYKKDGWKGALSYYRENLIRRHNLYSLDE